MAALVWDCAVFPLVLCEAEVGGSNCGASLATGLTVLPSVPLAAEVDGMGYGKSFFVIDLTVLPLVFFAAEVDGLGCGKSPVMGRQSEACFVTNRCWQRFEL